jgi:PhnB protein
VTEARLGVSHLGDSSLAMRNPPPGYQTVSPYLLYEDAARVIEYLKVAFGFVERVSQTGGAGRTHTELVLGDDGLVMLGQAGDGFSSPRSLGIQPPSLIHVYVNDVDALHDQAKRAGAEVTDLEMSPVGDRRFTATDPEGQVWVFAQRVADPDS